MKDRHHVISLLQTCKPDSVLCRHCWRKMGYHLSVPGVTPGDPSAYPSWHHLHDSERAARLLPTRVDKEPGFMWHFSLQGLPAINVAIESRELLPHIFTLTAGQARAVIFCGTVCSGFEDFSILLHQTRLFTGATPCAVRTFLPIAGAIARSVALQR